MFIKEITIEKYRILEGINIVFSTPENGNNSINAIAGINGCGKTSLLEGIVATILGVGHKVNISIEIKLNLLTGFIDKGMFKRKGQAGSVHISSVLKDQAEKTKNQQDWERVIYLPASLGDTYTPSQEIKNDYSVVRKVSSSSLLGNAEFYIKEYILHQERKSHQPDPALRTKEAVTTFNQHFAGTHLLTQLYDLDIQQFNRPVFKNAANALVTIDQLSDGEKQLYGRVVALMMLHPNNSIILIDEPEISLHPTWQCQIMKIYQNIGKNNQFIVATHSPQIIAEIPAKNIILLNKNKETNKMEALYPSNPPAGIDVNSILQEFMGASPIPQPQLELHRQYRALIEQQQEDSAQGQALRTAILQRESDSSAFMQEMQFMIDLRA